ncbi:MAG: rRNA pseudouridine synthase [Gemmatimonadetes bacterium]|nr:rRNA pseudouridine synthase [Gemmatimonadota bacterium]
MRLQKFLARAGVASRRKSEELIRAGTVAVDGRTVTELGTRIDPARARVTVRGRPAELPPTVWVALNKPPRYITARHDPQGRATVYDLLPDKFATLFHVGRLDFMTEGLLLLTNDGDLANRLSHPSSMTPRIYLIAVAGGGSAETPRRLMSGVALADGISKAAAARWADPQMSLLKIEIRGGRNREIRRALQALGIRIDWLKRVSWGPVGLNGLEPGESRLLSEPRVAALEACG